jgi:FkbM family methyltransferase
MNEELIMDQNQIYDLQIVEVMKRVLNEKSNCIDIDCHAGVILDYILQFSPKGFHHGFEPLPDLSLQLINKYKDNPRIIIKDQALSDETGVVTFEHVLSNPGYSGLKQRRYDRPNEIIKQIQVKTAKLDDIILSTLDIEFIKIDVEGAELQVLRGAKETLRRNKPVLIFEHGLGAADYYGTTPADVHRLLCSELGFGIHLINRWLENSTGRSLSLEEFHDEFASGRNFYFMAVGKGLE